jgi:transposase-like protein
LLRQCEKAGDKIQLAIAPDLFVSPHKIALLPHKTVCHGAGEYARDDDKDGFCEVYVNTMEGFWSLLRSWLRPHRGISQEKLPLYLGFFEFVHNAKKRGKALLSALLKVLLP